MHAIVCGMAGCLDPGAVQVPSHAPCKALTWAFMGTMRVPLCTTTYSNRDWCTTQAAGVTEGVGYSDPVGLHQQPDDDGEGDEESALTLSGAMPSHYTLQVAQA